MAMPRDTVYIDVDDEITAIIDKVRASESKIVALVLPKRATVFQSIVNMKLLKRVAGEDKKHIVLITSEAGILPLAGAVGVHVAKTLQSKPTIPAAPSLAGDTDALEEDDNEDVEDIALDRQAPVGVLAGISPVADAEETIEVDNSDETVPAKAAVLPAEKSKKQATAGKLKVPNFNKFRVGLLLGGVALVLLIVGWILAYIVLPKATVTIKTDTVDVTSSLTLTASPTIKTLDEKQLQVPGILKELKKTDTQKVPATGKKDVGTKAAGTVTLTLTGCAEPTVTVPAGTQVSSAGLVFVTQSAVTLISTKKGDGTCKNDSDASGAVNVTSQEAGDKYNLSARAYSVNGLSGVSAAGGAMTGGTSKIITIVSQQDIDGVKQKFVDANATAAKQEATKQLKDAGYMALVDTYTAGDPLVTASPNVDTEASEVTVTVASTYTMAGAQQDAVKQLLEKDIKRQIDTGKQNILSNGLDKAVIRINDKKPTGQVSFALQTIASAGVQQNVEDIRKAIAGKKKGEVQSIIQARPGVKDVVVEYSPFWVYKTPSSTNKINIVFQQSNGSTSK